MRIAEKALASTAHRPWPLPRGPWFLRQRWLDLAFVHWPVKAELLRPLIPATLTLQEYDGAAWLGVVPFRIEHFGFRSTPTFFNFPELNVRTYVEADGKPGVWFFSLDATSASVVFGARTFLHLPYFRAAMTHRADANGEVSFSSRRRNDARVEFSCRFAPTGAANIAAPGTLEYFLTERYCLYALWPGGRVRRLEVQHPPWLLQPGRITIDSNSMDEPLGRVIPRGVIPLVHVSACEDVIAWRPSAIGG